MGCLLRDEWMHTLQNFVDVGADEDPDVFIDEVIERLETEEWVNGARQYAARHTDTQAQADRLVQEIIARCDMWHRPWLLEKLPLVEPETDHQKIGQHKVVVSEDGDYVQMKVQIRAVLKLNEDGTVDLGWLVYKELELHKRFWDALRSAVLFSGDIGGKSLAEVEYERHVDEFIA